MRAGRRRVLAALVVVAAALVVGTTLTAAVSLSGGFDRAADRADLPHLIVRFDEERRDEVDARLGALPNVAERRYRLEFNDVYLAGGDGSSSRGAVHVVERGRRGYAIVEGRDVHGPDDVVVERGVAREWGVGVGDEVQLGDGSARVSGISLSPDNVAFPLTAVPRVYVDRSAVPGRFDPFPVNVAVAWLRDPARQDETLTQARSVSYGLSGVRFVTREGVRTLIGQAAGIVIALLVAFSAVAIATAGIMLGASARSEVARRLPVLGVQRAVGFSRAAVVREQAARAALWAAPAAALGLAAGALAVRGPTERLLGTLNEIGPGAGLLAWLAAAWAGIVALVAAASAWPAWRATAGPAAALLRGGELAVGGGARRWRTGGAGLVALGARLAGARRGRWAATVAVLGAASATLVLLLALASLLAGLRDDPNTVGKRYQLTADLDPDATGAVRRLPGVADAAPRRELEASAAYALGQPLRVIGLPAGAEELEAPALAAGRRRRAPDEAEVGAGLADALGLRPGGVLAIATPDGAELRFRVAGIVRALENEGRMAYVRSSRLGDAAALATTRIAVRLRPGADRAAVQRGLEELGASPAAATAATSRDNRFLGVLAAVLRVVALTVALVCLVVLAQALVLTARERRPTLALLRTVGAGRHGLTAVLGGACAAVLVPATAIGVALEALVLGPAVASLAAGYAGLSLAPGAGHVALVAGGLAVVGAVAVVWVAARVGSEPIVAGLREEA